MGKVEDAIRMTVSRLLGREIRGKVAPLSKDVRELKRAVGSLSRSVQRLEKAVGQREQAQQAQRATLQAPEEAVAAARLSPTLIKKLRTRLKLTQGELALVLGVSSASVFAWESGRSAPRGANRAALVALRQLGRRDVKQILAAKSEAAASAPKPGQTGAAKSRRKRRRKAK